MRKLIATYQSREGADAALVREALDAFLGGPLHDVVIVALYGLQQLWAVEASAPVIAAAERVVAIAWSESLSSRN